MPAKDTSVTTTTTALAAELSSGMSKDAIIEDLRRRLEESSSLQMQAPPLLEDVVGDGVGAKKWSGSELGYSSSTCTTTSLYLDGNVEQEAENQRSETSEATCRRQSQPRA
jgi:hypothetical protein